MKIYGYCRISTPQQSIERQHRNIRSKYPDAILVSEAYTGTKIDRPQWNSLKKILIQGDTVVFDSISRMSRDAEEGITEYEKLYQDGINLIFLKEPYCNTDVYRDAAEKQVNASIATGSGVTDDFINAVLTAVNKLIADLAAEQIRIAFAQAQKEVDDLRKRTSEGMLTAKIAGKHIGRVNGLKYQTKKSKRMKLSILKMSKDFNGNLSDKECLEILPVSRNSYYKYKRELKEEQNK